MGEITTAQLLLTEYVELQKIYESYNTQSLSIKEWSVSIGIASLLAAYAKPVAEMRGRAVVVLAALVAVPFYLTDALWKSYQAAYLTRLLEIEGIFGEMEEHQPAVLQGVTRWAQTYHGADEKEPVTGALALYVDAMMNPAVMLPHIVLLVVGLGMAKFYPPRAPVPQEARA